MKQKIYILGMITVLVIFLGTIFKLMHWPGAGYLLIAGIASLVLCFLPLALLNHYRAYGEKQNLPLHIITWLTAFVVFTSMLFKVQHWPYAGVLMTIALPFPYLVFLPVFLFTISGNKNFDIYKVVYVLFLLAVSSVLSALLALNVSATVIRDSLDLSGHYNGVEKVLDQSPEGNSGAGLVTKIDEVVEVAGEYKSLILMAEGSSVQEWDKNPGSLPITGSRNALAKALSSTGNDRLGEKLDNAMRALLEEAEKTPGYSELAKSLPAILGLQVQDKNNPSPVWHNLNGNLSWTLIYLDGVETNLKLIKTTLP
ncbi:MAG TPA: hypothetical protein P5348_03815 [Bacteroidales bacterium]|nr:hypothetical protein [Bacteroidales bacterium]HRR93091.1 hypothetical protein [Bacteroidales bacterium]